MKGTQLKELRVKQGWTQQELGEKIGLNKASVYKYEKEISKISETKAKLFKIVFGIEVEGVNAVAPELKPLMDKIKLLENNYAILNGKFDSLSLFLEKESKLNSKQLKNIVKLITAQGT